MENNLNKALYHLDKAQANSMSEGYFTQANKEAWRKVADKIKRELYALTVDVELTGKDSNHGR